jgi:hypothetical protein
MRCANHATRSTLKKLALTSGDLSVDIARSRTKAARFSFSFYLILPAALGPGVYSASKE